MKNLRKWIVNLSLILIFINFSNIAKAQVDPIYEADSQLRVLFSPLDKPATYPNFLYEMSAHIIDSAFFQKNSPDTLNYDTWNQMYREMRYCAYDTTGMITYDSVYHYDLGFGPDTVCMNIMAYDYYTFIDSALTTNTYFTWDTVAGTLTDKYPRPGYPYLTNTVFSSCPSVATLPYKSVVYRIDPKVIFHDLYNPLWDQGDTLMIDFADGTGWHTFNPNIVSHYAATYADSGEVTIATAVKYLGIVRKLSYSVVTVPGISMPPLPDSYLTSFPGMKVGVYEPCTAAGGPPTKYIIYVEGIDFGDIFPFKDRWPGEMYSEMIKNIGLSKLRNFGYEFLVVDWANSRLPIEVNAMNLVALIKYVKCQIAASANPDEQIVVIGESMGGLVSRYALAWMENNIDPNDCMPNKMHDVRELITFDSPNAGANIPLAYQHFYRDPGFTGSPVLGIMERTLGIMDMELLDAPAAQEMLINHVDTRYPPAIPPGGPAGVYGPHPLRVAFLSQLSALGNYPKYCKLFATCNGSIGGLGQTRDWDGAIRNPGDNLAHFNQALYVRLFKHNYEVFNLNAGMNTSPNGTGPLCYTDLNIWVPKIKLKWFGIKVTTTPLPVFSNHIDGMGLQPYDVAPGSILGGVDYSGFGDLKSILFAGHTGTYLGSGMWEYDQSKGGKWFGGGFQLNLSSDGMQFAFIPTVSSLDYNYSSLWDNIETTSISTKLSNTPFDVINGVPSYYPIKPPADFDYIHLYNMDHLDERTDCLGTWFKDSIIFDTTYYRGCASGGGPKFYIPYLNREIGDDSLFLENRTMPYQGMYDAKEFVGINLRSLYYEYPGGKTRLVLPGMYSKDNTLDISSGYGEFYAKGANVIYQPPVTGPYSINALSWVECCNSYKRAPDPLPGPAQMPATAFFTIYPNPATTGVVNIKFKALKDAHSLIQIFNITGQKILEIPFAVEKDDENYSYAISLQNQDFPTGNYFIIVMNGGTEYKQKLVIKNNK